MASEKLLPVQKHGTIKDWSDIRVLFEDFAFFISKEV